jgi:hypothetical protein
MPEAGHGEEPFQASMSDPSYAIARVGDAARIFHGWLGAARHGAAVRCELVRLTATSSQPGNDASGQNSGAEDNAHCLEGLFLDGMSRIVDCVFGGMAALFHCFDGGLDTFLDGIGDDASDPGDLTNKIFDRCLFSQKVCWHEFRLLGLKILLQSGVCRNKKILSCVM